MLLHYPTMRALALAIALALIMLAGSSEARRRGGPAPLMRRDGTYTVPKMDPDQMEAAAKQVRRNALYL